MSYLHALHDNARREDATRLRAALADLERERREADSAKRRRRLDRRERALRRRLAVADALAEYDWAAGEAEFVEFVRGAVNVPGVYERWRRKGVPVQVLLRAGYRPDGARRIP